MAGATWHSTADCVRHPHGTVLRDDDTARLRHGLQRGLRGGGHLDLYDDGPAWAGMESTGDQGAYGTGAGGSIRTHCYGGRGAGGCEARTGGLRAKQEDEAYYRICRA